MPIYTDKLNPWKVAQKLTYKDLIKFQGILEKAKKEFFYKDDYTFCKSIQTNYKLDAVYVASYDYSKTGITLESYIIRLQYLINEANRQLSRITKYNNYKFDIIGSWTIGKIIMMEKK